MYGTYSGEAERAGGGGAEVLTPKVEGYYIVVIYDIVRSMYVLISGLWVSI